MGIPLCGGVGAASLAKLTFMVGGVKEELGLDPKLLARILNMSSGRCWSSDTYNPVPGVMDGDLGLAQSTATDTKTPVPLGSLAHQIYRVMCARGYANKDFSSVFQFLREEEGQ
ncbi:hypothetical protein CRUP_022737 [Coryphaenoides rupestris]|nr:hypothetical protein CRUP_022737 [Coryphaenoides rupestris]